MVDDHDRLPLTRSVEADVLAVFSVPTRTEGLKIETLLSALGGIETTDSSLNDALSDAGFKQATSDNQPVLDWIDAVFAHWKTAYPLAPELHVVLQQARSLAAAFALRDRRFFIPGGHVLHRLLDAIHNGFAGWHKALGGAAISALDGARDALVRSRQDFPSEEQVAEALEILSQKIQAHEQQLQQLGRVLMDREAITLCDEAAQITAAVAINEILAEHEVPGSVARFIKSDWYESGVLIINRNGEQSDDWRNFMSTTQLLVDAVQPVGINDAPGQSRLQTTMHQLPATLARQLLSLAPNDDAIAGAIGLIEYALLRNMRGEDLGLLEAALISVKGLPEGGAPSDFDLEDAGINPGQWYILDTAEGELRIRLAGTLARNIYVLFMDFLGTRVLRKTTADFKAMLKSGEARPLNAPDSFCRAMVEATDAQRRSRNDAEPIDQQATERPVTQQTGKPDPNKFSSEGISETIATEPTDQETTFYSKHQGHTRHQEEPPGVPVESTVDYSAEQAISVTRRPNQQRASQSNTPTSDQLYESNTVVKLQIPMGTWMGFHDRDPPLMAKVAARDLEKDSYIFTNREGIKLRELTVPQLIALIDRDMVDILERKSNFRETINQMRQEQDRLSSS